MAKKSNASKATKAKVAKCEEAIRVQAPRVDASSVNVFIDALDAMAAAPEALAANAAAALTPPRPAAAEANGGEDGAGIKCPAPPVLKRTRAIRPSAPVPMEIDDSDEEGRGMVRFKGSNSSDDDSSDSDDSGDGDTLPLQEEEEEDDDLRHATKDELLKRGFSEEEAEVLQAVLPLKRVKKELEPPALKKARQEDEAIKEEEKQEGKLVAFSKNPKVNAANKRAKNWCFTLNNYVMEDQEFLISLFPDTFVALCFGREVGEQGTPHLQGTFVLKNAKTLSAIKKMLDHRFHLEQTIDIASAVKYCKKDGDFVELGVWPEQSPSTRGKKGGQMEIDRWDEIKRNAQLGNFDAIPSREYCLHLNALQKVHDVYQFDRVFQDTDLQMLWLVGPSGSGKSRWARRVFNTGPFEPFLKLHNKWWDGYKGQENVLIDDLGQNGVKLADHIKQWADRYQFPAERKGGAFTIRPKRLIITSNYEIVQLFPEKENYEPLYRRFSVLKFSGYKDDSGAWVDRFETIHKAGEEFTVFVEPPKTERASPPPVGGGEAASNFPAAAGNLRH